ncbi:MAG: nucleotidyltransferase family protein [Halobacteriovoraceae bacterium]|jgi:uncharacterized protein|nr:nucleotidyltransferase family protein [Halobacteriovoraceae bacterium]
MNDKLIKFILEDQAMVEVLKNVRGLNLPDCWIGAGFVRNKAWDLLHGFTGPLKFTDVDVVFFDKNKIENDQYDKDIEEKLKGLKPDISWEVVNQARTHQWHHRSPYIDTTDAISEWVETATCIGIRLTDKNELIFTAPHGFKDLENLILRPVPSLKNIEIFNERIFKKKWLETWPKLKNIVRK